MKVQSSRLVLIVGFICSVVVAFWAISSESLWVDEFGTWLLTRAESIPDWWKRFLSWPDSDAQIPLYHFYMYLWTKVGGTDAVAMRVSNVGMFVIANLALLWPFRSRPNIAVPLIVTSCASAPIWYYLNEIRPYIMLYMGFCLMVGATIEMLVSRDRPSSLATTALCVGAVVVSGASVLGIAWAGSIALFILIYWLAIRKDSLSDLINKHYFTLAIAVLCIAVLVAHDFMMLALGKRPVVLYESNILTLGFSFYGNLGLLGVGPGMLDMRANSIGALVPFLPIVGISAILFGLIAIGGLLETRAMLGVRTGLLLIGCIILPVLFTFALGLVLHWRVLPRHLLPLAPLFSLLYAFGLAWWWRRRSSGRAIALASVVIMAYSSLSIRYAPRHAKDDYKHAAELAAIELARDGRVWWFADPRGASYYGIPYIGDQREWPQAIGDRRARIPDEKMLAFLSAEQPPTLVLLSKPDVYDREQIVSNYLSANKYRLVESFPAFTAWKR